MRRLAFAFLLLAACGSGSPCHEFCSLDCQNAARCSNDAAPSGASLDACVKGCDDAYQKAGYTDTKQCNCGNPGEPSCSSQPGVQFVSTFKC